MTDIAFTDNGWAFTDTGGTTSLVAALQHQAIA